MVRPLALGGIPLLARLARRASMVAIVATVAWSASAQEPRVISGMTNPESIVVVGGKIYVTTLGEVGKEADGLIVITDPSGPSGKVTTFASGFDDPRGMIVVGDDFYVADVKKVWRVNAKGKAEVLIAPEAFPRPPISLNDLAYDGLGNFYVSDSGDRSGAKGAMFRFNLGKEVTLVLDAELTSPQIAAPAGLLMDDPTHLFVADSVEGYLYRYDLITGNAQRLGGGFGGAAGLAPDGLGGLYLSDSKNGRLFLVSSALEPARPLAGTFGSPTDIALTPDGRTLLVADGRAGTLTFFRRP